MCYNMFNTESFITFKWEVGMLGIKDTSKILPLVFSILGSQDRKFPGFVEGTRTWGAPKKANKMVNFKERKKARKQQKNSRKKNR